MTNTADDKDRENEALREQIKLYQEQNKILVQYVDDAKSARTSLEKQVELNQDRERLFLIREQRDYHRIVELEKKLELLAPPAPPQEVNTFQTHDMPSEPEDVSAAPHDMPSDIQEPPSDIHDPPSDIQEPPVEPRFPSVEEDVDDGVIYDDDEMQDLVDRALKRPKTADDPVKETSQEAPVEDVPPEAPVEDVPEEPVVESASENEQEGAPREEPSVEEASVEEESKEVSEEEEKAPINSNQNYLINEYFNRGLGAAGKKQYEEAIEAFTKVTEFLPDAAPSYLNLAIVYFRIENFELALDSAQKAVERGSEPAQRLLAKIEVAYQKHLG